MRSYSNLLANLTITLVIALLIVSLRSLGLLESLELIAFDHLMRLRPNEEPDERLLIIEITEKDVQAQPAEERVGASLSDRALAQLLAKLKSYQPRTIGLNIYRDRPVDNNYPELAQAMETSDRLFTVCHYGNPGVIPPPEVSGERQGFNNVILDTDDILRRHLLAVSDASPCQNQYAFSLQIAAHYLSAQFIAPELNKAGYLQFSSIVLKTLEKNSGGYSSVDAGGHQILLNYRATPQIAETITLTNVLKGQLRPNQVKNRIVLIGTTAPSFNDHLWRTPYTKRANNIPTMAGIEIQAHMVSQILSAVLDNRPLIWWWTQWEEKLWIVFWGIVGGILTYKIRNLRILIFSTAITLGMVYFICFLVLTFQGGWIPFVPAALVLVVTSITISLRLPEVFMISKIANVLKQCKTSGDIAAIANQLAWISSPTPSLFGLIIPQFLSISQSVRAAQEATSPYRQYELLGSSVTLLRNLQDSIFVSANALEKIQLGKIPQHWLKILQTAQHTLEEAAKRSAEILQVYIAGPSLNPDDAKTRFKGRQDIFREIETLAFSAQPPILLLHGGRRTGKTSTLRYLPRKVGSELIPLLIDLQGAATATTLNGLANYLAEEIIKAAKKSRNFDLPYPNPQKLSQEPFLTLQTWLEKLERIAPGKRFLLCLDEFERLSEVIATTNSRIPLNFFRHVLQHRRQWILLFSGSHTLDELEPYWSDYLINTRSLRVSYLQQPEAEELIVQPIADFPKIYESLTVSQIIQATRCQPYLVQLLCTVIVDYLNREKRRLATPDDVQTCIPIAIETGGMYFRELWTSLSEPEQDFLEDLITEQTPHPPNKSTVRRLIRKEILEKTGDDYQFQVPLVERFITQVVTEG